MFLWSKDTHLLFQSTTPPNPKFVVDKSVGDDPSLIAYGRSTQFFDDLMEIRNLFPVYGGVQQFPLSLRKLYGVDSPLMQWYEPDPRTCRHNFYYNTRLNRLYMKITKPTRPFWKQINL